MAPSGPSPALEYPTPRAASIYAPPRRMARARAGVGAAASAGRGGGAAGGSTHGIPKLSCWAGIPADMGRVCEPLTHGDGASTPATELELCPRCTGDDAMTLFVAVRTGTGQATPVPVCKLRGMPRLVAFLRISPPGERAMANFAGDLPTAELFIGDIKPLAGSFGSGDITGEEQPNPNGDCASLALVRRTGLIGISKGGAPDAETAAKLIGMESTCIAVVSL